jgi:hypothetical protein
LCDKGRVIFSGAVQWLVPQDIARCLPVICLSRVGCTQIYVPFPDRFFCRGRRVYASRCHDYRYYQEKEYYFFHYIIDTVFRRINTGVVFAPENPHLHSIPRTFECRIVPVPRPQKHNPTCASSIPDSTDPVTPDGAYPRLFSDRIRKKPGTFWRFAPGRGPEAENLSRGNLVDTGTGHEPPGSLLLLLGVLILRVRTKPISAYF